MYIGANQDSILEASKLGINAEHTLDFDANTVHDVMRTVSIALTQQSQGTPTTLRQCSVNPPKTQIVNNTARLTRSMTQPSSVSRR